MSAMTSLKQKDCMSSRRVFAMAGGSASKSEKQANKSQKKNLVNKTLHSVFNRVYSDSWRERGRRMLSM